MEKKNQENRDIDLMAESDRGAVIVGAAILESKLDELLRKEFEKQKLSKKQLVRLFDLSGPLSSFGSKILVCRSFNIISEEVFHDLDVVRRLRNRFAHSTEDVDFSTQQIANIVNSLHAAKEVSKGYAKKAIPMPAELKGAPPWEIQAKGLYKYPKSLFALCVKHIELSMLKHSVNLLRGKLGQPTL